MFNSKFVKVDKEELALLIAKADRVDALESKVTELKHNQSEFLMSVVKRQSAEIEKLSKYQEQDDTLYSYEQTNEKQKLEIVTLKAQLLEANSNTNNYRKAYENESNMGSLLVEKIINSDVRKCQEYKTQSLIDVIG